MVHKLRREAGTMARTVFAFLKGPKTEHQESTKRAPREPKNEPKLPKEDPGSPQDRPRQPQDVLMIDGLSDPRSCPKAVWGYWTTV